MGNLLTLSVLLLVSLTACTTPALPSDDTVAAPTMGIDGTAVPISSQVQDPTASPLLPTSTPMATLPSATVFPAYPEPLGPNMPLDGYTGPYPTATITPTPYPLPLVTTLPSDWLWFIDRTAPICHKRVYAEGPDRAVVELTQPLAGYVRRLDTTPLLLLCDNEANTVSLANLDSNTSIPLNLNLPFTEYEFEWRGPALSPDGTYLAFVNRPHVDDTEYQGVMYIADTATGEVDLLFEFPKVGTDANMVGWDYYAIVGWRTEGLYYLAIEETTDEWNLWKVTWNPEGSATPPYNEQNGSLIIEEVVVEDISGFQEEGREYFTDPLPPGNSVSMPWIIYEP